jgi:hypothetical protein
VLIPPPIKRQHVSSNKRLSFSAVFRTSTDSDQKPHRGFFFVHHWTDTAFKEDLE